jgi:hypothetical protein
MECPEFRKKSLVIALNTQRALTCICALQVTLWDEAFIKFAMRTSMSPFTLTRMGLGFETVHTSARIRTKDVRISALYGALDFTEFSDHGRSLVHRILTVAVKQGIILDSVFQAIQARSAVITDVAGSPTQLILAVASKARHAVGTLAMPSILIHTFVKVKGESIDIRGLVRKVGVSDDASRALMTV